MTKEFIKQASKYTIVGILGTGVDAGTFFISITYAGIPYLIANIISSHLGIFHNFVLNSIFTFKVKDSRIRRFGAYYAIAIVGMGISTILLGFAVERLSFSPFFAKICVLALVTVIQFLFNKFVTFKKVSIS